MTIAEKIQQYVRKLPSSAQVEVLEFVEYLLAKSVREKNSDWTDLSLTLAMRGMEDEVLPTYTTADLKVVFT